MRLWLELSGLKLKLFSSCGCRWSLWDMPSVPFILVRSDPSGLCGGGWSFGLCGGGYVIGAFGICGWWIYMNAVRAFGVCGLSLWDMRLESLSYVIGAFGLMHVWLEPWRYVGWTFWPVWGWLSLTYQYPLVIEHRKTISTEALSGLVAAVPPSCILTNNSVILDWYHTPINTRSKCWLYV
jgi:hypothetical protein